MTRFLVEPTYDEKPHMLVCFFNVKPVKLYGSPGVNLEGCLGDGGNGESNIGERLELSNMFLGMEGSLKVCPV